MSDKESVILLVCENLTASIEAFKSVIDKTKEVIESQNDAIETDDCTGCVFEDTTEWEMPCRECRRIARDYWRKGE